MDAEQLKLIESELAEEIRRGETPDWVEYLSRFPDDPESLKLLFDRRDDFATIQQPTTRDRSIDSTIQSPLLPPDRAGADLVMSPDPVSPDTVSFVERSAIESTLGTDVPRDRSASQAKGRLPRIFGPYELIDEIARGGMGVVFRARQIKLNRLVALKMILSGELAGREQIQRFYAEAESAAALDHPGIVPVFEVGEHDGQHFFSMGLVDGVSLAETIREQSLSPRQSVSMLMPIVDAVRYAHECGVIHRDLKPSNVLIDATGQPRVTDFGLAKRVANDSGMTASGQIMGTPSYMPPEQAAGRIEEIDVTADVYSLGAILYEMLVGRPPFRGTTPVETLRQVLDSEPVEPSRLNPSVDRDLETICLKCLSKNRAERYATAAELNAEFERYLDGRPIEARRLGVATRTYRWCRRRPLQTSLIAASILLITLSGAFVETSRRADRAVQTGKLKSTFASQLTTAVATQESISALEALLEALRVLDPNEAEIADKKLTDVIARTIENDLRESSINEKGEAFREMIHWVRTRDAERAERLEANLQARLTDWKETLQLAPPFNEQQAVGLSDLETIRITQNAIEREGTGNKRVIFGGECTNTSEIEVTFSGNWRDSSDIGLLLSADKERGYEFVVTVPVQTAALTSGSQTFNKLEPDDDVHLEIRKFGSVLQRKVISVLELPTQAISLRARRERDQLSFQIENLEPLKIRDVFALSSERNGRFGLIWPPAASVIALRTRFRDLPLQMRPVEQADFLLDSNKLAEALDTYQKTIRQSGSAEERAESRYKAGICLLKMNRADEAVGLFDIVRESQIEPWGLLASCQRWLLHLQVKELEKADAVYDQLAASYNFTQLAAALPIDQRTMILDAFFTQAFDAKTLPGLARIERAMALDRLMSIDGRGQLSHQEACIKAVELAGRVDHAERLWINMMKDFPTNDQAYYRLSMLSRTKGNYDASLEYIEKAIRTFEQAGRTREPFTFLLERIRTTSARKQDKKSLEYLNEFRQKILSDQVSRSESIADRCYFWSMLSHESLLRGFALDELGRNDEAIEVWRQGYESTRPAIGRADAAEDWLILNVMILGSLSGELKREDIPGLVVLLSGSSMPQQLAKIGVMQIGEDIVHRTLLRMWQSPHGKRIARDGYALHQLSYQDRLRYPMQLAGQEFIHQTAFETGLTADQRFVVEMAVDELIALIESKQLGMADFIGFAMAWKSPGPSGHSFGPLIQRLPAKGAALASYLIAHRLIQVNADQADIGKWLDLATSGPSDHHAFENQVDRERMQWRSKKGLLQIENSLGREVQVQWIDEEGVAVSRTVASSQSWELAAGTYDIRIVEPSDAKLPVEGFTIRPLAPQNLKIESDWMPGPDEGSWPGIVIQPTKRPGVRKWQFVTREPRSRISSAGGSRDGRLLALAGRDGVLRIYQTSDGPADEHRLLHLLPGHATYLSSVSWSDDGHFVLTTSVDNVAQLWRIPEAKMVASIVQPSGVISGAISPDGSQFATGSYDGIVRIFHRDGTLHRGFTSHPCQAQSLCWTRDGQNLVSADAQGKLRVWDKDKESPQLELHYDGPINLKLSNDRKQIAVWSESAGTIDLLDTRLWRKSATVITKATGIASVAWVDGEQNLAVATKSGQLHIYTFPASDEDKTGISLDTTRSEPLFVAESAGAKNVQALGENHLVSVGSDGFARIWNTHLAPLATTPASNRTGVNALEWHPLKDLLAVGRTNGSLCVLDSSGKQVSELDPGSSIVGTAWSRDGNYLAISRWNKDITILDDGWNAHSQADPHSSHAMIAWTPQGDLMSANDYGEVRQHSDLSKPYRVVTRINGRITSAMEATRDALIFPTDHDSVTRISITGALPNQTNRRSNRVNAIAWNPSNDWVGVSVGGATEIFESNELAKTEPKPLHRWSAASSHIRDLAWTSDGQRLYALIDNGQLVVWDQAGTVVQARSTKNQLIPSQLAISPDDQLAVAGSGLPFLTFYHLPKNQAMLSIVMLDDEKSVTIYPGGYSEESLERLDAHLACVAMNESGVVSTHTPSTFLQP